MLRTSLFSQSYQTLTMGCCQFFQLALGSTDADIPHRTEQYNPLFNSVFESNNLIQVYAHCSQKQQFLNNFFEEYYIEQEPATQEIVTANLKGSFSTKQNRLTENRKINSMHKQYNSLASNELQQLINYKQKKDQKIDSNLQKSERSKRTIHNNSIKIELINIQIESVQNRIQFLMRQCLLLSQKNNKLQLLRKQLLAQSNVLKIGGAFQDNLSSNDSRVCSILKRQTEQKTSHPKNIIYRQEKVIFQNQQKCKDKQLSYKQQQIIDETQQIFLHQQDQTLYNQNDLKNNFQEVNNQMQQKQEVQNSLKQIQQSQKSSYSFSDLSQDEEIQHLKF